MKNVYIIFNKLIEYLLKFPYYIKVDNYLINKENRFIINNNNSNNCIDTNPNILFTQLIININQL
jgi:hypothetical protein